LTFRPRLESLEDRAVPAATPLIPIDVTSVALNDAQQLVANIQIGSHRVVDPITLSASPAAVAGECPILHLQLEPINLDVLGLQVETSAICLDITAQEGSGNLLGNLLCDVAGLLDNGASIGSIIGGLSGTDALTLVGGLTSVLDGVFTTLATPASPTRLSGSTDILTLSLGPVDLNLLGLGVHLDDCNNGPVTLDIRAVSGSGNLLGNLLGGVAHLLDNPGLGNGHAIDRFLDRISDRIGDILG